MTQVLARTAFSEKSFDYVSLPMSKQRQVQEETEAIRQLLAKTATNIVQIGLRLRLVHNCLGRKHFQAWLRAEFCWSQSVASNYMRAAAFFGNIDCLPQFQPGALYVLARRRVPDSARQNAVDRAIAGELITKSIAEEIVFRCRPAGDQQRRFQAPHHSALVRQLANEMRRLPEEELHQLERDLSQLLSQLRVLESRLGRHGGSCRPEMFAAENAADPGRSQ